MALPARWAVRSGDAGTWLITSERRVTGLSAAVIADLVAELGPVWQGRRDAALLDRPRRRAVGAGAKYKLVFVDLLLAILVHLRHGVTHDVMACWFQVDRSTITRAAGEIRPLLADRGCRTEGGLRLRRLADVITYLGATGQTALMDATEIRIRRPGAHRGRCSRFISGKSRINAMKALAITDERGRPLLCGEVRAGSVADITQARDAGLADLLADTIDLQILADAGYQGLTAQTHGQIITPPRKRRGRHSNICNGSRPTTKPHTSPTPQPEPPSNTASPTSRTGEPSPGTTPDETACPTPSEPSPNS
ncbi:transposase family protein [Streptomyces sp. NPDC056255]|uniref:transposase family protein n=1 Tax=Streptomyces sp. NPDC056255 TaxID=3345764 RepID=UPI0035DA3699